MGKFYSFLWFQSKVCFHWICVHAQCTNFCDPIDSSPPGPSATEFSRQEHWSGLPFPPPGFPTQGIEPVVSCLLHWQVHSLPPVPPGKPQGLLIDSKFFLWRRTFYIPWQTPFKKAFFVVALNKQWGQNREDMLMTENTLVLSIHQALRHTNTHAPMHAHVRTFYPLTTYWHFPPLYKWGARGSEQLYTYQRFWLTGRFWWAL